MLCRRLGGIQMSNRLSVLGLVLICAAAIFQAGCSEVSNRVKDVTKGVTQMIGGSDLPDPISTSLEMMPRDAAQVALAVERQIAARGNAKIKNVLFAEIARTQLAQATLPGDGLVRKAVHLYEYSAFPDNPIIKKTSGLLIYEGAYGRRASIRYEAQYRPGATGMIIDHAAAAPYFSDSPETVLFVVDRATLPHAETGYPNSYPKLIEFVGRRAIQSNASISTATLKRDYVIFVFFRDRLSPSAKLMVKIANDATGTNGYSETAQYINFNGWSVAALPGRFAVPGSPATPPLYVKVIHTPGKEAGLLRRPKLVGLYHISGAKSVN